MRIQLEELNRSQRLDACEQVQDAVVHQLMTSRGLQMGRLFVQAIVIECDKAVLGAWILTTD